MDKPISYLPTDGLTYEPNDPRYWQPELLAKEVTRTFEICHGCRLCFKYCDSFPTLFRFIDERHDGDVHRLAHAETQEVFDACFQCKLCEVQCPYTERDQHEYRLDFPKLVHRFRAIQRVHQDPSLRERVLADPDTTAQFARLSFGLANRLNEVPANRWLLEQVLGIHRDKKLPDFAGQTFGAWAKKAGRVRAAEDKVEAVLFPTCFGENNAPELGRDALAVLDKNQVDVTCVADLGCCGMPAWEQGDLNAVRARARHNLDRLMPYVDRGAKILVVNPTCSMMMRREYPALVEAKDRSHAEKLAGATRDACEYLWSIREQARFSTDFKSTPGPKVAYHAPCHLRAQGIGFKGRDLLRKIPGVTLTTTMECSGHDGTYAMKVETFEASKRVGERAFEGMKHAGAEVWATECPLAAIQLEQHGGTKAFHPLTILARAYREDGFPRAVRRSKKEEG